jgi:hypothetical protein
MENVNQTVTLKAKDTKEGLPQAFGIGQANKLLKMSRSQFELHPDEKNWTWNGIELAKVADSKATEPKTEKAEKETKKD